MRDMSTRPLNCDDTTKHGREWGRAHGYYGMIGGWIGHPKRSSPICQGWEALYRLHAAEIEHWRFHRWGFSAGDLVWWYRSNYRYREGPREACEIVSFTPARVRIKCGDCIRIVKPTSLEKRQP